MIRRLLPLLLLPVLLLSGCKKEPVDPEPETDDGAPIEIMVVFAPGQLGDRGYADDVMDGINSLDIFDDITETDTLDIRFLTPLNVEEARSAIVEWAESPSHPFSPGEYERRLLVLTEPFMAGLLSDVKDKLRPADEVLLLKLEEEDIAQIANQFGLGNRVHGLNISAATPAVKFCQYMRFADTDDDPHTNHLFVPFLRLYDNKQYPYRDGIVETVEKEMGDGTQLLLYNLSDQEGEGIYTEGSTQTIIEAAFEWASMVKASAESSGCPYVIVDLGAGNAGWDYFLLGESGIWDGCVTLMLDSISNTLSLAMKRFYIKRHFGMALMYWVYDWWDKPVGEMDRQVTHTDSFWYEDNLYV